MGTLSIAMESNETIASVSFDDLFVDDIESPSDTEVKEINDILEQAIELSSTVPCFNPLKNRNFSSSLQGGTDADNGDMGKRRLRSDSGKNADADLLSQPMTEGDADLPSRSMTEGATDQMCAPNCRGQQIGRSKVHTFDDEAHLRKQKQPQFTVEEIQAEPHKLIGRKLKRFFPGYGGAFATISKYDAEKKTYFCEYADGYTEWLSLDDVLILLPKSWIRKELEANMALLEGP